jgi:GT2 family glycosyltransferase
MTRAICPFVTVIIPTYQRPAALTRCLASLAAQDYPADCFEVVVADDGSDVPLDQVIAAHAATLSVVLLRLDHGGPAAARNQGAAVARGEILGFIDDDCIADPGWISALVGALSRHADAAVGGAIVNGVPENPYVRASHTLLAFLYRYYHEQQRGWLPFFTTNNLAVRGETFAAVGGFDPTFPFASEDRDWSDRCRRAGHPLVHAPDAVVVHAPDLSMGRFLRMHFRYGEGAYRFHRARAARGEPTHHVERVDFYAGMLTAPFAQGDRQPIRQSFLLLLSQAVATLGFAQAAWRARRARRKAGTG